MPLSPDLHRLRLFLAVLDAGSVTEAARNLGYAPSTVSEQLRTLSREAGGDLFRRRGAGIEPTSTALALEPHARTLMREFARANGALRDHHHGVERRICVDFVASAGSSVLSPAAAAFTHRHSGIRLELTLQQDIATSLSRLRDGDLDIVFGFDPLPETVPEDVLGDALEDPFIAVLPVDHELAGRTSLSLSELRAYPWISHDYPIGSCSQGLVEQCRDEGFEPPYEITTDTFATAADFAAAGLGVAVMPALALNREHPDTRTVPIAPSGVGAGRAPHRRLRILRRAEAAAPVVELQELLQRTAVEYLRDWTPQTSRPSRRSCSST